MWPYPKYAWHVWGIEIFYNNFEVVKVAAFRDNPAIAAFNAEVDATRNIYRYRWGDAPLRWLQVRRACHIGKPRLVQLLGGRSLPIARRQMIDV